MTCGVVVFEVIVDQAAMVDTNGARTHAALSWESRSLRIGVSRGLHEFN